MRGLRLGLGLSRPGSSSVSLIDPSTLTLAAWWDPSDLATMFQSGSRAAPGAAVAADGDPVGLILDKSGNSRDLVADATAGRNPLYRTSGGLRWLEFDGVNDMLISATLTMNAPFIRSTALKQISWTSGDVIWDMRAGNGVQGFVLTQNGTTPQLKQYHGSFGNANSGAAVGTPAVTRELWTQAAGVSLAVNNGTPVTSAINSLASTNGFTLGADVNKVNSANVAFYGAIILPGSTPNSSIDTYLGAKAGIVI